MEALCSACMKVIDSSTHFASTDTLEIWRFGLYRLRCWWWSRTTNAFVPHVGMGQEGPVALISNMAAEGEIEQLCREVSWILNPSTENQWKAAGNIVQTPVERVTAERMASSVSTPRCLA